MLRTEAHTRTDNVKTVYPPQTKFAGGIKIKFAGGGGGGGGGLIISSSNCREVDIKLYNP